MNKVINGLNVLNRCGGFMHKVSDTSPIKRWGLCPLSWNLGRHVTTMTKRVQQRWHKVKNSYASLPGSLGAFTFRTLSHPGESLTTLRQPHCEEARTTCRGRCSEQEPATTTWHVSKNTYQWLHYPVTEFVWLLDDPSWGPRHHVSERSHLYCTVSEFLIQWARQNGIPHD